MTGTLTEESNRNMVFQRKSCAGASESVETDGSALLGGTGVHPVLLLAPLDADAAHVLSCQLEAAGLTFQVEGPVFALDIQTASVADFLSALQDHISGPLQHRVKGVIADGLKDRYELVRRLMHAELLTELFDRTDAEWIRTILTQEQIFSVFHPIVSATNAEPFAYEALIRARSPQSGDMIGAGQLVYAARRLNMQREFDRCARVAAIRGAAKLGLHNTRLFVNFMPNTIYDPEVCLRTTVEEAQSSGFGMERIVFEVVETEQVGSIDQLRQIVAFLRRHGAGVALDDLSSGYASLQFLADVVPDYVKIDRDLVSMAAASGAARHTVESIVSLARKLEVRVIAEGVETDAQLKVCLDAGVDYLQGFLFALPCCPPQPVTIPAAMRRAA